MRRLDKERIKVFKEIGLYELLCETREKSKTAIMADYIEVITQPLYKNGSDVIREVIDDFYNMAIDHAWGKEKKTCRAASLLNNDATGIAST